MIHGNVGQGYYWGANGAVGTRVAPGQWTGANPATGASFDATRTANPAGSVSFWDITRTGPAGYQQHNDFTVVRDGHEVRAYDLNRSGFQPLPKA